MEFRSRESFVTNAMNVGMARAAKSFSVLLGSSVKTNPPQIVNLDHGNNFPRLKENDESLFVFVTQMIGDFNGKSYLIFNHHEVAAIGKIFKKDNQDDHLSEAFLMEIDNIVSAAVISELSNLLKVEIYGDVPVMKRFSGVNLYDFIAADKDPHDNGLVVINTGFTVEKFPDIHPQFIWKFSPVLLEMIPANLIAAQNR
jgi:chemotaxis protein CheY-P-specific phosphatase CheC